MSRKKVAFFVFVCHLCCLPAVQSKTEYYSPGLYEGPYIWLTFGVGKAPHLFKNNAGLSGAFVPTVQVGKSVYSLRALVNAENPLPLDSKYYGCDEYMGEIGLLYGRCYKSPRFFTSLSTGLARVTGMRRGGFLGCPYLEDCRWEERKMNTIGLALESQLFIQAPLLGFGLYIFGNINAEHSFGGFLLSVQVGYTKRFLQPAPDQR